MEKKIFFALNLWLLGLVLILFNINNIDNYNWLLNSGIIFWLGIIITSISLVFLSYNVKEYPFLMLLFITSAIIMSIPLLRYGILYGSDILGELDAAQNTLTNGNLSTYYHRYSTCISISIFPPILSQITGINLLTLFEFLTITFPGILSFMVYLVTKNILEKKDYILARLTAIIFTFHYVSIPLLPQLIRETISLIFMVLVIVLIFKKKNLQISFLAIFLVANVTLAHFSMGYFVIGLLVGSYALSIIIPKLTKKIEDIHLTNRLDSYLLNPNISNLKINISKTFLVLLIIITITWLMYITYSIFNYSVVIGKTVILQIINPNDIVRQESVSHAFNSSLGFFHTIIKSFFNLGSVIGLFIFYKKIKSSKTYLHFCLGMISFIFLLLWVILSNVSQALYIDRVLLIGLVFFSLYIAIFLNRIVNISLLKNNKKIIMGFFITILLIEAVFWPPLTYQKETNLDPQDYLNDIAFRTPIDYQSAIWTKYYISNSSNITADTLKKMDINSFGNPGTSRYELFDLLNSTNPYKYLLTHNIQYIIFTNRAENYITYRDKTKRTRSIFKLKPEEKDSLTTSLELDRIYDNGKDNIYYSNLE